MSPLSTSNVPIGVPEHDADDVVPDAETHELLIGEMQAVRERNNTLWMDLVRLAFKANPDEAKAIAAQIKEADAQIADLWVKLGQ